MSRYIDADTYIKYCDDHWIPLNVDAVNAQPTADVVDVVRCKDCKHSAGEGMYCAQNTLVPFDHFYCYYGERREDEIN